MEVEAPLYTFYWGLKKIICKICLLFKCVLVIKRILKVLIFFHYKMVQAKLLQAKLLQNSARFIQKLTPGFKNHIRNWDNFRQAVVSLKS